ncbi:MAG: outer membrane protein assembly factor BamE [Notoacmeibacter sp.]|nr:outer membrane protein assembly factor BamE [Notoacmeibacter sp.]
MEMHLRSRPFKSLAVVVIAASGLTACNAAKTLQPSETLTQGYVMDQQALELVPVGSSREQVLLALGTPSTTSNFTNEVFYYISQTRRRSAAFMNPKLVDQKILTVYFGDDGRVSQIATYGLQDGRLFDFNSNTTPVATRETSFIGGMLKGLSGKPTRLPGT